MAAPEPFPLSALPALGMYLADLLIVRWLDTSHPDTRNYRERPFLPGEKRVSLEERKHSPEGSQHIWPHFPDQSYMAPHPSPKGAVRAISDQSGFALRSRSTWSRVELERNRFC